MSYEGTVTSGMAMKQLLGNLASDEQFASQFLRIICGHLPDMSRTPQENLRDLLSEKKIEGLADEDLQAVFELQRVSRVDAGAADALGRIASLLAPIGSKQLC
ncbi:MAG: hypothetical protein HY347_12465 [candidate division NC10 bacterium]|nr:hypothetical protein [candidate division NC10 bacterium]